MWLVAAARLAGMVPGLSASAQGAATQALQRRASGCLILDGFGDGHLYQGQWSSWSSHLRCREFRRRVPAAVVIDSPGVDFGGVPNSDRTKRRKITNLKDACE